MKTRYVVYGLAAGAAAMAVWGYVAYGGEAGGANAQQMQCTNTFSENIANIRDDVAFGAFLLAAPGALVGGLAGAAIAATGKKPHKLGKDALVGALIGAGAAVLAPIPFDLGAWARSGCVPALSLP